MLEADCPPTKKAQISTMVMMQKDCLGHAMDAKKDYTAFNPFSTT